MRDVCYLCGGGVVKTLLHCSNGTAVFHRECDNGHKLHRITGPAVRPNGIARRADISCFRHD